MGGRVSEQLYSYSEISGRPETENYVKDNLPTRYTIASTRYIDYTYDSLNRLTGKTLTLASPLSYAYTYKASDRGGNYTTSLIATETIGSDVYSYTYDKLGNITSISLNGEEIRSYKYDSLNQLTRENNKTDGKTYVYAYDGYGNIKTKKIYAYTTGKVGAVEKTVTYQYSTDTVAGWKKLLTEYNGEAITYDAIGNPLTYRGATLDWNERQLKSYDKGNTSVTYKYDADGLRASKTVNGDKTTYQYVSGKLMYENRNGTDIYYYYDSNGVPTSIKYYEPDGTNYRFYIATNQLGDIIGIYNASGSLVVKYEYDAWGNIISTTNANGDGLNSLSQKWSDINPFRYRGYYYDSETGLYYVSSRYYDPEIGRWINADGELSEVGGDILGYNLFAYCFNNPVNMDDPSGEWPKWLSGALNVVSGVAQMAAGAALGAFTSWTGIGAVAAGFLIVNGAATVAQGTGQIVNHVTKSNTLREDNIVRTGVQEVGRTIGGDTGAKVAGGVYDIAVVAANLYAGKVSLEKSMPKIIESKVFSANNGYGIKLGKNIEMFYRNPNAAGGPGGTIFSYKGPLGKFRIDWDPAHGFHCHPPGH